ncbi:MAG: hypothetical protein WCK77_02410 [Verrucomicrobiota bacterium]
MRPAQPTSRDCGNQPVPLLFAWRGSSRAAFTSLGPIVLTSLAFAFLLGFVRIKVAAPQFKMADKASWIQLPATGNGVAWALRAKEGGPMLARYEPSDWGPYAPLAAEVLQATRIPARPYAPALRALPPEGLAPPMVLADKGTPVMPRRAPPPAPPLARRECRLAPLLYPLSAVGAATLPLELPPFSAAVDEAMAATDWRFLLRLHPGGGVAEAVALTKAAGSSGPLLENWLRGVCFDPKLAADGEWLAVGIRFNNQTINGTDPH